MYDFVSGQGVKTLKKGVSKFSYKLQTKSLELILLNELIQIERQELEGDASMVTECEIVTHVNYIHTVIFIQFPQMFQDPDLLLSLPMKAFLIANHFESHVYVILVIEGLDDLAETSLPDHFENLIAIANVIVLYVDVGALIIVVAIVVGTAYHTGSLFGSQPDEVDLRVVLNLCQFVRSQSGLVHFDNLVRGRWGRLELGS